MYHDISLTKSEGLTISIAKLEQQFKWLVKNNYKTYHLSELEQLKTFLNKKNIVLTFDDGFVSQLELALQLLEKYNLKATFFIPLAYLGKKDEWNAAEIQQPIMTLEQLKSLNPNLIELAYHSFYHRKYDELSAVEISEDSKKCFNFVKENKLIFFPAVAYPYGKYPRETEAKPTFFNQLKNENFKYGLRIGNRLNSFPFKNPFEIQRIDVKGEFTLSKFKSRIKWGKLL